MLWIMLHPRMTPDQLGFLPDFMRESDPRPAKEQIDENYRHGGGWFPMKGFSLNKNTMVLTYPEDPPLHPLAMTTLREEKIYFYPACILLILQPDGSFEAARVD